MIFRVYPDSIKANNQNEFRTYQERIQGTSLYRER